MNRGLHCVMGTSENWKTSFVLALAHHYHANLFIPESVVSGGVGSSGGVGGALDHTMHVDI